MIADASEPEFRHRVGNFVDVVALVFPAPEQFLDEIMMEYHADESARRE